MSLAFDVVLVSAQAARVLDEDLPPLQSALTRAGLRHVTVDWDDATFDWTSTRLALIRSTWDYTTRLAEFLSWCERTAKQTQLHNPLELIRWNTDKHYLADLSAQGISTVPSTFFEPGQAYAFHAPGEFVLKPCVGAGSRDAARFAPGDGDAAQAHAQRLLAQGRSVLAQPYLDKVDSVGESALIFFDGVYSHAIRKGPLLARGADAVRGLFKPEHLQAREPGADERALAERIVAGLPVQTAPLYARVDLLRDDSGAPCLLELELTEPSLFFDFSDGSADRLVAALIRRL